nr:immunoglobulin light chain junction region [Macaca mulatta]
YIQALEFPWTF